MDTITTASQDVVRTTSEFGFGNYGSAVLAVTFSGRRTPSGPRETFSMNAPRRGFNRKDGTTSLTNRSGNWGNVPSVSGYGYVRVYDFKPETIRTKDGGLAFWNHTT